MMDATLGYILCCQSPTLFLTAAILLVCYFVRRRTHRTRGLLDLALCIICTAAGVALYFLGMGKGYFTIRDFYAVRVPGWVGMALAAVITLWLSGRTFAAASRRRSAEKAAIRAANAEAQRQAEAEKAAAQQREAAEKAANAAAAARVSETVEEALAADPPQEEPAALPDAPQAAAETAGKQ